jgi:site-specific DNA-methyltransferase (adenine-specific)
MSCRQNLMSFDSRLFCGDSLDIMRELPDNSVDAVITDPPYNIGYADWDLFKHIEEVAYQWNRLLTKDGSLFCFCGWSFVTEVICNISNIKDLRLNDWIIYDRVKGRGGKRRLVSTREDLLWYVKSDNWTFNKANAYSTIKKKTGGLGLKNGQPNRALSNVWTDISPIVPWSFERNIHPTQKPVQLMERIVSVFTNENDIVLDSFMGSGTTGVACMNLNRRFVGIELDKEYFQLAEQRIQTAQNQTHEILMG